MLGLITLALAGRATAVERLPVEDFAREPVTARARLSPDGKRLAFVREYREHASLHILDIDQGKLSRLDLGEATIASDATKEVGNFRWINDHRLVITTLVWDDTLYGVMAVNWNGSAEVPISGYEDNQVNISGPKFFATEVIHSFNDKDGTILMLNRHAGGAEGQSRPDILQVNTMSGQSNMVLKNPGEVARWGLDFDGVARLGILASGGHSGAIYRENEQAPWRTILPLQDRGGHIRPVGFDRASGKVLVGALTKEKRWTVFPLDPATGTLGEPLLTDPEYDIVPDRPGGEVDGIWLAGTIFSQKKQALVGIRYFTELSHVKWFDRDYAGCQMAVDHVLPNTVNLLVDASEDEKRMLWYAFSDQDPGSYYLMDQEKHSFKLLGPRMTWIKPAQMAQMLAVKYHARDGLVIHGYLTVPAGHQPKDLPLVVMPHGGPWLRDVWGFEPLVQLLANRGYAVLQMNYRGSPGYGIELFRKARRQIGREIQDDIEDATRWAIAAGVADPKHIAIMGSSYGGYSALFALGKNPELYRCGISLFGVSDWPAIFDDRRGDPDYRQANKYWRREIGDPDTDQEFLASISPVNFADKIAAPVLIIQGKQDRTVPQDQAKRMIAALEKTGRKPESLFLSNLGHSYGNEKQRLEIYKSMVGFLEKNLGPGVR